MFKVIPLLILILLVGGCVNASVTQSSGGGGQDASSCIVIDNPGDNDGNATVTNSCNVSVNFIEFSTGSQGLIEIAPMSAVQQNGIVFAWGACIAPAIPDRIEEFDFQCID